MSRDMLDGPASQLFLFWGAGFVYSGGLWWVAVFPVGLLVVAGGDDVVA